MKINDIIHAHCMPVLQLLAVDLSCGPPNIQSLLVIIVVSHILCWCQYTLVLNDDTKVSLASFAPSTHETVLAKVTSAGISGNAPGETF